MITVGTATYDDYQGVFFTLESLRMYHPPAELVIIDNNPPALGPGGKLLGAEKGYLAPHGVATQQLASRIDATYVPFTDYQATTVKGRVFDHASNDIVLVVDSHVLLSPGSLPALERYLSTPGNERDLVYGVLLADDLSVFATHMDPIWQGQMWGVWGTDDRGRDPTAPAFDIPHSGGGCFAMRREHWVGFNPEFRGFGGEEGYLACKARKAGGKVVCLPSLRWLHRFNRPDGIPYVCGVEHKLRNYILGLRELGMDAGPAIKHFSEHLTPKKLRQVLIGCSLSRQPA